MYIISPIDVDDTTRPYSLGLRFVQWPKKKENVECSRGGNKRRPSLSPPPPPRDPAINRCARVQGVASVVAAPLGQQQRPWRLSSLTTTKSTRTPQGNSQKAWQQNKTNTTHVDTQFDTARDDSVRNQNNKKLQIEKESDGGCDAYDFTVDEWLTQALVRKYKKQEGKSGKEKNLLRLLSMAHGGRGLYGGGRRWRVV